MDPEYQAAQRAYMRYHNMNPIFGISSKYVFVRAFDWQELLRLLGMYDTNGAILPIKMLCYCMHRVVRLCS